MNYKLENKDISEFIKVSFLVIFRQRNYLVTRFSRSTWRRKQLTSFCRKDSKAIPRTKYQRKLTRCASQKRKVLKNFFFHFWNLTYLPTKIQIPNLNLHNRQVLRYINIQLTKAVNNKPPKRLVTDTIRSFKLYNSSLQKSDYSDRTSFYGNSPPNTAEIRLL